jgi:hypothetical protein
MNRAMWMAVVAVACATSAFAAGDDDKTITVSGCVQNFSSTGTDGVTERGFLLSNPRLVQAPDGAPMPVATQDTTAAGVPTGTSGTAAPGMPTSGTWAATSGTMLPPVARAKNSYRLDGSQDELKAQVGHKVEISGSIEPKTKGAPKSDTERLQVAKVKMLGTDCSK